MLCRCSTSCTPLHKCRGPIWEVKQRAAPSVRNTPPHPTATPPHTCDWLHSSYGCERLLAHQDCTLDELTSFTVLRFNSHSRVYLQGASQKHTQWRCDAVVSAVTSQKQGCVFDSVGWLVPLCGICMFSLRLNEYSLLCCGCSKRIYERTIIKTNRM